MKLNNKINTIALTIACTAFLCLPVFSKVIWYGDTSKGYLDSFYRLSKEPGEEATVSVVNVAGHGKVWAVNKPAGSKRSELARTDGWVPAEGETMYIGWKMKVNIEGNTNPSGMAVYQLKSDAGGTQNYPVLLGYDGKTVTVTAYRAGSGSQASRGTKLCSIGLAENTWLYIVLGIKFSKDITLGYTEVWFNGVKQNLTNDNSYKQYIHRTLDSGGVYCKWGAYNESSRPFNVTNYLDEMRVATTYEEANPYTYEIATKISNNTYNNNAISVYPNPAQSSFTINLKDVDHSIIKIFNSRGELVYLKKQKGYSMKIDADNFNSPGVYFIKIIDNKGVIYNRKLIIS